MNEKEYLEKRVEDQISWYEKKSASAQFKYKSLRLISICLSVSIPFLTGFISDVPNLKVVVGFAGVIIAFNEGVLGLFKYHENWIEYRKAAESFTREKMRFLAKSGIYSGPNSYPLFVERIESFSEKENQMWSLNTSQDSFKS